MMMKMRIKTEMIQTMIREVAVVGEAVGGVVVE